MRTISLPMASVFWKKIDTVKDYGGNDRDIRAVAELIFEYALNILIKNPCSYE